MPDPRIGVLQDYFTNLDNEEVAGILTVLDAAAPEGRTEVEKAAQLALNVLVLMVGDAEWEASVNPVREALRAALARAGSPQGGQ